MSWHKQIPIPFCKVALCLIAILTSCGRPPEQAQPQPRLVILYATCSLNKNFLSPYNPEVRYTRP